MNTCTRCEKPLTTPLDEFGPDDAPLCRSCFLDPADPLMDGTLLRQAERELEDVRSDLADQQTIVSVIEDQVEDDPIKQDLLDDERREMRRLQDRYNALYDRVTRIKDRMAGKAIIEQRQLEAWKSA